MNHPAFAVLCRTIAATAITTLVACGGTNNQQSSSQQQSESSQAQSSSSVSSSSSVATSSSSSSVDENLHASCPSPSAAAFEQFPRQVPGYIQAEDFDPNGYSDTSVGNEGSDYRDGDVDIKAISGGYAVGWMTSGEYLEFTVNVEVEGNYPVVIRSGAVGFGRTLNLSQCDQTLIEGFDVPNVSDWGQFKTWEAGTIHLTPGLQKLRITVGDTDYLDLDWVHIGQYNGNIDEPDDPITGANHPFFIGNITTSGAVRSDFNQFWDQITPENEGKWGSVERNRDQYNWAPVDRIYEYARANNIPVKAHTFVWGSQRPAWIDNLSPAEQAAEVEEWIRDYCARYPDTQFIDVVNEAIPGHAPAMYAESAFGSNWVIKSFQLARQYCPNAILILNDYNVLSWNTAEFLQLARPVVNAGVVDAIGLQSHGLEDWALSDISNKLNQIAALGLPIYISEYDVNSTNDQTQLSIMQEQFPLFYNHPSVKGITIWGYIYGRTWREGTGLIRENGTRRPAMNWLLEYLQNNPK